VYPASRTDRVESAAHRRQTVRRQRRHLSVGFLRSSYREMWILSLLVYSSSEVPVPHFSWWTFTGCGCRNASNTNCPCSLYRCFNGKAPRTWQSWQRLSAALSVVAMRSASSTNLVVLATPCSIIGDHAFVVAGPRAWNSLPPAVRSSATYNTFKKTLNLTFLDYPSHCDIVYFDYVQRSCSSLYRLQRWTNCPILALNYVALAKSEIL